MRALQGSDDRLTNVVAGFGSPYGDDQVGWLVIDRLAARALVAARLVRVREGTELVEELEGCQQLLVVDACRSDQPAGSISRIRWPDPRFSSGNCHSTHGIGLCHALELAQQLGRLPSNVEFLGVVVDTHEQIGAMSTQVLRVVDKLASIIEGEFRQSTST